MPVEFINIDLEIEFSEPLDHLCRELDEAGCLVLYNGSSDTGFLASFEIEDEESRDDPNAIIISFCDAINSLGEQALLVWDQADRRVFDIGYESCPPEGVFTSALRCEVLDQIAKCGADVKITIYQRATK
ncbi:hypothetical protein [Rubritalea profundi]|uniref:Uncharacterized protein n=1 Tax=Rubritalea profundi TaxID=1658618 RepID=A0A2S7U4N6_9BACT|nr:hypothetical protein [Rubritalea profundi]PQJ29354.1 hypothetical protein BSZ32_13240 [Rubritalea profundi]